MILPLLAPLPPLTEDERRKAAWGMVAAAGGNQRFRTTKDLAAWVDAYLLRRATPASVDDEG